MVQSVAANQRVTLFNVEAYKLMSMQMGEMDRYAVRFDETPTDADQSSGSCIPWSALRKIVHPRLSSSIA